MALKEEELKSEDVLSSDKIDAPELEVKLNKKAKEEAKPQKAQPQQDKSRLLEYLKNEHKWENYVLLVLSFFALILGLLILNGTLTVNEEFPLIGNFPRAFAGTLVALAVLAILLSLWPFFKPAFPELKKVRWLRFRDFLADSARVFIFMFILVAICLLYDAFISKLIRVLLENK